MNPPPDPEEPPRKNAHFWCPPSSPPEDYPFVEPRDPPASTAGGPVSFARTSPGTVPESDFQEFVWDIVNAISRVNAGLFAFKKGVSLGLDKVEAAKVYEMAVRNYQNLFEKWEVEIGDENTWVQPTVSYDGYVTEVVVRSRKFSIHTPGQSQSHNSTNPPRRV